MKNNNVINNAVKVNLQMNLSTEHFEHLRYPNIMRDCAYERLSIPESVLAKKFQKITGCKKNRAFLCYDQRLTDIVFMEYEETIDGEKKKYYVIIDERNYVKICQHKWCPSNGGYLIGGNPSTTLQRAIYERGTGEKIKKGHDIHHKNSKFDYLLSSLQMLPRKNHDHHRAYNGTLTLE